MPFQQTKNKSPITYSYNTILFFLFIIVHVRKRNTLVNGCIISSEYPSQSEMIKRKTYINPSLISVDENKHVRPYFLIRPQTVLMLPNETGKFNGNHFY